MNKKAATGSDRVWQAYAGDRSATFEAHRGVLVGIAYRILGSRTDADDVVQAAWIRWAGVDTATVVDPRAFLVRVVTRLAIDHLRRARVGRETYVGEWLPEPVATGVDPLARVELVETLATGLLVVLETLSPLERAVFVLREAFGLSHAEIAEVLDRSEVAVRQLALRARRHVEARRRRHVADPVEARAVTERFLAASASGDLAGLIGVLAPDVRLVADGGGRVRAPLLPVVGADRVARFLRSAAGRQPAEPELLVVDLNGGPAILLTSRGEASAAVTFDIVDGRIAAVYLVANPDKLQAVRRLVA